MLTALLLGGLIIVAVTVIFLIITHRHPIKPSTDKPTITALIAGLIIGLVLVGLGIGLNISANAEQHQEEQNQQTAQLNSELGATDNNPGPEARPQVYEQTVAN